MKLEVGKKYLTRNQKYIVEILMDDEGPPLQMHGLMKSTGLIDVSKSVHHDTTDYWTADGTYSIESPLPYLDLVSEYTEPPKQN
jgi:hypothetical protein